MKKDEAVETLCKAVLAQGNLLSDGKKFFLYNDTNKLWRVLEKKEIQRCVRAECCKRDEFYPASIIKNVSEEMRTNSLFAFTEEGRYDFPAIVTTHGVVNLIDKKCKKIQKDDHIIRAVDFQFLPEATWGDAPNFQQYANSSLDIDLGAPHSANPKKKLLLQILVYCLSNLHGAKKMFVLLGPTNCGKSVLMSFLRRLVGDNGYVPLSLSDLTDRFRSYLMASASLILNDEMAIDGVKKLDLLKKIISEEPVPIEKKGEMPETYIPRIKLVYAANALPILKEYDAQGAFALRLQPLVFKQSIPRELWDLDLFQKIWNERDAILSMAINECCQDTSDKGFLHTRMFAKDPDSIAVLEEYRQENVSVESFISDKSWCHKDATEQVYTKELYGAYQNFCTENDLTPVKFPLFRNQLAQLGFYLDKGHIKSGPARSRVNGIGLVYNTNIKEV